MPNNPCYNPDTFTPDNKPLLSKGDWSMVQLYLKDCKNLPLVVGPTPPKQFPFKDSVDVYNIIHEGADTFATKTLPQAMLEANFLFNYGNTSISTFQAVANMMAMPTPPRAALQNLFGNIKESAILAQAGANKIFTGTKTFADMLGVQGSALSGLVTKYLDEAGGVKDKIANINLDIKSQQQKIKTAQATITADEKIIKDTVYYSWIPLVGTIVALVEIIEHQKDIEKQLADQTTAVKAIQADNVKLHTLQSEMAQLVYAESFNEKQIGQMNTVLPSIQKIEGSWGTIAQEVGDILSNINKAQESELKNEPCLSAVSLTTAQHEWTTVANDAHDFMTNFYVLPVTQMPKVA